MAGGIATAKRSVISSPTARMWWTVPLGTQTMSSFCARTTVPPVSSHSSWPAITTHHSSKSRCQCGRLPLPGVVAIRVTMLRSSSITRADHGAGPRCATISAILVCSTFGQLAFMTRGAIGPSVTTSVMLRAGDVFVSTMATACLPVYGCFRDCTPATGTGRAERTRCATCARPVLRPSLESHVRVDRSGQADRRGARTPVAASPRGRPSTEAEDDLAGVGVGGDSERLRAVIERERLADHRFELHPVAPHKRADLLELNRRVGARPEDH